MDTNMVDNRTIAMSILISLGWEDYQAAGIVGNLMQESYPELNPIIKGDGGHAFGICQWHRPRQRDLQRFCEREDYNYKTLEAQVFFVDYELSTTEKRAGNKIRKADNLEDAVAGGISYLRPRGFSWKNPHRGHGWDRRLDYAHALLDPDSKYYTNLAGDPQCEESPM